jgi:hypothetical protein
MPRETHRVAVTVFAEAEGADGNDAASVVAMVLRELIHDNAEADGHALLGSAGLPTCDHCGVRIGLTPSGNVATHMVGETWSPDDFVRDNPAMEKPDACAGSGQPPHLSTQPVIGFTHRNGATLYARVHDVMETGMALGNGYLWAKPTSKAFRFWTQSPLVRLAA